MKTFKIMKLFQNPKHSLAMGSLMLIALSAILFAFSTLPGGDSFSISVNKKLLFQQYVHADKSVKAVSLTEAMGNDVLTVRYSHCGVNGKDRSITVKDARDKVLKQWHFVDIAEKSEGDMNCTVKEILSLGKTNKGKLSLVYSSRELPEGRTLAAIETPDEIKASLK
jgi:hypothetical protein